MKIDQVIEQAKSVGADRITVDMRYAGDDAYSCIISAEVPDMFGATIRGWAKYGEATVNGVTTATFRLQFSDGFVDRGIAGAHDRGKGY